MKQTPEIDTFYEVFNSSRCKTAMLLISLFVFLGVVITEIMGHPSQFLQYVAVIIVSYWMGRTTKANDPANKQIMQNE